MLLKFIMLPLVGALIGWVTNVLAIKLIFRPYEPIKIPLTKSYIQGLIPKRRDELAINIGRTVEENLLSVEDILAKIKNPELKKKMAEAIVVVAGKKIKEKIPPFIMATFGEMIMDYLNNQLTNEIDDILDDFLDKLGQEAKNEIHLGQMVEERIEQFELSEIEALIVDIAAKELKHIEILGGVLGFVVGIFQALILVAVGQ